MLPHRTPNSCPFADMVVSVCPGFIDILRIERHEKIYMNDIIMNEAKPSDMKMKIATGSVVLRKLFPQICSISQLSFECTYCLLLIISLVVSKCSVRR